MFNFMLIKIMIKMKGMINMVTGFVKMNNELSRKIITDCGLGAMGFYYILLSHKNDSINSCYPSNECLMKECDITKPTLNKYIKSLIENGYIKVSSGNVHKASNYYFPLEVGMYTEEELDKIKSITRRKGSNKKKLTVDEAISLETDDDFSVDEESGYTYTKLERIEQLACEYDCIYDWLMKNKYIDKSDNIDIEKDMVKQVYLKVIEIHDDIKNNKKTSNSNVISEDMIKKALVDDLAIYYKDNKSARDLINKKCNGRKFSSMSVKEVRDIYNIVKTENDFEIN